MFSATMPANIQKLANNILNNPVEIKLAVSKPAEKIVQAAYVCYENQKLNIIQSLFSQEVPEKVIIFASSKLKVKEVTKALKRLKLNVGEMHSDLDQAQDYLKIDQSFIRRIGTESLSEHIVDNVIDLGHRLGLALVAEGVETREQAEYLKGKVTYLQGLPVRPPRARPAILWRAAGAGGLASDWGQRGTMKM